MLNVEISQTTRIEGSIILNVIKITEVLNISLSEFFLSIEFPQNKKPG